MRKLKTFSIILLIIIILNICGLLIGKTFARLPVTPISFTVAGQQWDIQTVEDLAWFANATPYNENDPYDFYDEGHTRTDMDGHTSMLPPANATDSNKDEIAKTAWDKQGYYGYGEWRYKVLGNLHDEFIDTNYQNLLGKVLYLEYDEQDNKSKSYLLGADTEDEYQKYDNNKKNGMLTDISTGRLKTKYSKLEFDTSNELMDNALYYNNTSCLYHAKTSKHDDTRSLATVIDLGLNQDGEYVATTYNWNGTTQTVKKLDNQNVGWLAASIYWVDIYGTKGWQYFSADAWEYTDRAPIWYYFHLAKNTGAISISYTDSDLEAQSAGLYGAALASAERKYRESGQTDIDLVEDLTDNERRILKYNEQIRKIADGLGNYQKMKKESANTKVVYTSSTETILGPFKLSFGDKKVENVQVEDFSNANISWSKRSDSGWNGDFTSIPNNENFYLRIRNANLLQTNNIKVKFTQQEHEYVKARFVVSGPSSGQSLQHFGIYGGKNEKITTTVDYSIENGTGTLIVNKRDLSDENVKLNMGFKVKLRDSDGNFSWLGESNGAYRYNINKQSQATLFRTDDPIGTKTLENLSLEYQYQIWEVEEPSGYNLGDQDIDEARQHSTFKLGQGVRLVREEEWINLKTEENHTRPEIYYNRKVTEPVKGKIIVKKTKLDLTNQKLDMGFKVKVKIDNFTYGWLKLKNNGNYSYTETKENATEFRTNDPLGSKTLPDLDIKYKYQIWETTMPTGYNIEDQTTEKIVGDSINLTGEGNWIELNEKNNYEKTEEYKNKVGIPPTGKIILNKTEKNKPEEKLNITFIVQTRKISDKTTGWLSVSGNSYKYDNTQKSDATRYITLGGTKSINSLSLDYEYRLWEIQEPNGGKYKLIEQPTYDEYMEAADLCEGHWINLKDKKEYDKIKNSDNEEHTKIVNATNIDTTPKVGSITILKEDYTTRKKLRVGIKIETRKDGTTRWLKLNGTSYTYTETERNAEKFYTDGGILILENMSLDYQYRIWEFETDSEEYTLSKQGLEYTNGRARLSDWINLKTTTNNAFRHVYSNVQETGNMNISKKDATNNRILTDAKFMIQTKIGEDEYWFSYNKIQDTGNWIEDLITAGKEYKVPVGFATRLTIDEMSILLREIPVNVKYRIWEVEPPSYVGNTGKEYYKLKEQPGYRKLPGANIDAVCLSGEDWIDLKDYKNNSYTYTKTFYNYLPINISITKKGKETDLPLKISFKVQVIDGKESYWLKEDYTNGIKYDYTNEKFENAKVFETANNGTCTIENLRADLKYKIWEIRTPAGYKLSDQEEYQEGLDAVDLTGENLLNLRNTSATYYNKAKVGDLVVNKKDELSNEKLKMGFKVQVVDQNETYWLVQNQNGTYNYKANNKSEGTTFYTDEGTKTLTDLSLIYKYNIWEVEAPTGYDLNAQNGTKDEDGHVLVAQNIELVEKGQEPVKVNITNGLKLGKISVTKKDKEDETIKLKMGFKVQTRINNQTHWLSQDTNGNYNYNSSNGTTFYTDSPIGTKLLENLNIDNIEYKVWETEAPEGYELADQDNYIFSMNAVELSDWFTIKKDEPYPIDSENTKEKVTITGYVWLDKIEKGEDVIGNSLYDETSNDKKVEGVTVSLKRKSNSETVISTTSKDDGSYIFEKAVLKSELDNYYIQFDYSNMGIEEKSGKRFIPVKYNGINLDEVVENGSRAMMESIPTRDSELTGIAMTYMGTDTETLKTYGLSALANKTGLYNSTTHILSNINLGLREIYTPTYEIMEDLKYVKIVLNNHEYIYKYGEAELENVQGAPQINKESTTRPNEYIRSIYPSAIYDLKDGENLDGSLKVYAVYEIAIADTTYTNAPELYTENKLQITELTNTFDTNRFELETTANSRADSDPAFTGTENNIKSDFANWENVETNEEGRTTVKYKENIEIERSQVDAAGSITGGVTTKYIQFKVKDEEVERILNNPEGLNENKQTTANANGYHEFTRYDYSWENIINLPKMQNHESEYETKEDKAPYLKFTLGEERKITGTIFNDKNIGARRGEIIGNGRMDDGENKIKNAKIEFLIANPETKFDDAPVAKRYIEKNNENGYEKEEAITYTDTNGNFIIDGLMPGDYYLRVTYGNGSQIIDGENEININIDDYKSTIVTSRVVKNIIKNLNINTGEWYKNLEGDNYSVAVDSLDRRERHNSGEITDEQEDKLMIAGTPMVDITVENTQGNYHTNDEVRLSQGELFKGFNFGIIIQPKQRIEMEKVVTSVRLTNAPNNIFNGNPETDNMPGVTDLDGKVNGGSTFTRMEVEESNIYGSNLALRYNIRLKNASDINYYETRQEYLGYYYMFGEVTKGAKTPDIYIENIIDCYDPSLQSSESNDVSMSKLQITETTAEIQEIIEQLSNLANAREPNKYNFSYKNTLKGKNTIGRIVKDQEKNTVTLEFSKILSNRDEDLNFVNTASVSKATNVIKPEDERDENIRRIAEKSLKYIGKVSIPRPAKAEATVSTPTGSNTQKISEICAIVGIILLTMAANIIIVYKRKKF